MKKCRGAVCFLLCFCMLFLAACGYWTEEGYAQRQNKLLKQAINDADANAIADLFADCISVNDASATPQDLVDLFPDGVRSVYIMQDALSTYESINDGVYTKNMQWETKLKCKATGITYGFLFLSCKTDTENLENVGIHSLLIFKESDDDAFTDWWRSFGSSENPTGIYLYNISVSEN